MSQATDSTLSISEVPQGNESPFVSLILPKPESEYSTHLIVEIKIIRTEIKKAIQDGKEEIAHPVVGGPGWEVTETDINTILQTFRSNGYMAGAYGRVLLFHWGDAAQKIREQLNPKVIAGNI
jgi:hypothetical protein